jgi:hypothetical protein
MSLDLNTLKDDETYVDGRSPEQAAELLALAEAAGLEGRVFTTSHGYIVPTSILGKSEEEADADADADADDDVDEFDPSKATVEEVQNYLDGADDAERERVLAAEAQGKDRKALRPATSEGDK